METIPFATADPIFRREEEWSEWLISPEKRC